MSNERMLEAGGVFGADKIDVETEEIPVDDAVSEVNENALSETQATGDEEHEERQINVGEDDEDDDVYGDDAHEDEEMEQGEIHEEDEPMDEDEEENDEEGGLHDEEDELEGEEDHEMVHDDKHDDEVEHADEEAQEHGQTEENKAELSYSTRGRAPTAEAAVEMTEHGIREMFEELGRVREPSGTGASFLDSLTEEERRTRTRFLPDVEGIHQLRKHEVKSDIALARSLISTTAPTSTRRPRGKRNRGDDDVMEEEEEDGVEPSEDDKVSDSAKVGSITIDLRTATVTLPSSALVAPPPLQNGSGNGDSSESRDNGSVPSSRRWHNQVRSPLVVEAITAFNPPRPPESVGGKKKHRMLRWERRPTDIEDDLNIYRKTVQRTREELQSAERERERVETVNAHLRRHFLSHLAFMNEEWAHLSLEMRKLQEECIKTVNRLSSRMKDRNAMKASQAMEEALLMLKTLGADLGAKGAPMPVVKLENSISGIGGISSASFVDWDRATKISSTELASSWILPGDSVTTPYGEGIVVRVLGASPIGSEKPTLDGNAVHQENGNRLKNGSGTLEPDGPKSDGRGVALGDKDGTIATTNLSIGEGTKSRLSSILPPRVCVRLTFGEGYFNVDYVSSRTNPATYSDAMLAQRWLKMTETAHVAGENLDVEGMAFVKESAEKLLNDDGGDNDGGKSAALNEMGKGRFLPFGAGLLPTGSGRGGLLAVEPLAEIETGMQAAILGAQGVLGKPSNEGVPATVKEWEDLRQEKYTLKAKALQLRNELLRQRRTRLLNDRTLAATKERCLRIESLATEMRSDLNTLKERLDDELVELGINSEMAEDLLKQYFTELEESMIQEEAQARHRMSSDDYTDVLLDEVVAGKARERRFSDDEDASRFTKKARVGQ